MKKTLSFFVILFILFSCSSDDSSSNNNDDNNPVIEDVLPVITTENPVFHSSYIRFNGTVLNAGNPEYYQKGFCWGYNTNPVLDGSNYIDADGSGTGAFFADYPYYGVELNQTYNVRAFAVSPGGTVYGNNITFTTPNYFTVTLESVTDITSKRAVFKGSAVSNTTSNTIYAKGFCFSTTPNPTISNSTLVPISGNSLGNFTADISNLSINTTYYVRAYGYNTTDNVMYSSEISFKTTGYVGASGGYVFYDKGDNSDGWRYLEASPVNMSYNGSNLIKWGCNGSNIYQTYEEVGTGLENTNRIISNCNDADCAARVCKNYTVNGLSDWFLPSRDEMGFMRLSLNGIVTLGNSTDQVYWTSTEYNSTLAFNYNTYYDIAPAFGISKNNSNLVRAVRRY